MEVYRITKEKYASDITGKGAELYGGRWNPIGIPALYTSESRALCALELLVHTRKEVLPPRYIIITLEISTELEQEIEKIPQKYLRENWDCLQPEIWTQEIGLKYFQKLNRLGIRVPSSIIKEENNIVLNPLHERYGDIKIIGKSEFKLDERLMK